MSATAVAPKGNAGGIKELLGKSGTFHAEIVLSAMANEYYDHVQARWALQVWALHWSS